MSMRGRGARLVKVPDLKVTIKEEVLSDNEEDTVSCLICHKMFASPVALRNHAMMEHYDAFATGDPANWTSVTQQEQSPWKSQSNKTKSKKDTLQIQENTAKLLSSMTTGTLTTLASEDVSYIIIKSEDGALLETPLLKRKKVKVVDVSKGKYSKKQKDTAAIKGPFECTHDGKCHRIFFSCCEYSIHYRDEHTRRRAGLRCQVCEKPLTATDSDMPFNCDVCGTGFNTNKELSDHMSTVHVKLKPFECSICHKRFTQQGGVQQHMRMHTGDRPFNCSYCPKSFTQKSGLDQHLRIHTKVKPYRCIICAKSFCQSIHLKQHMRTHTNVSPFQCGICQKRFKQSSHLNYHLRNHNTVAMTDEQKQKYAELIGLMNKEVIEFEVDQVEIPMEQTIVEQEDQLETEQTVQIIETGEEYVVPDGEETWTVQFVES